MRELPVAALQEGDVVTIGSEETGYTDCEIKKVQNSTPTPGLITWDFTNGGVITYAATHLVQVAKLA